MKSKRNGATEVDSASPAMQLLGVIWEELWGRQRFLGRQHSCEHLNSAMVNALSLAIGHGLRFAVEDFAVLYRDFCFAQWGGVNGDTAGERFYSIACAVRSSRRSFGPNPTAAQAFEHWKKRKPFIIRVHPRQPTRHRIAIGSEFIWYGLSVTCTSFAADGSALIACSYKDPDRSKVGKRVRITQTDIREYHRIQKEGKQ